MKTSHEFARELLGGPDLPVATPSLFDEESASEPIARKMRATAPGRGMIDIVMISGRVKTREGVMNESDN